LRPGLAKLLVAGLLVAGCGESASPESGITALMRVSGAQFVSGPLSADAKATTGTAAISGVGLNNLMVYPGEQNFPLTGVVTGVTALVGLENDAGYWIVPAPIPDLTTVGGFVFTTQLTFSPLLPNGSQTLVLRGVAADGTVGPAQLYVLTATVPAPVGALVISLNWDTESDMDLHVVMPNVADPTTPIEIWNKHEVGLPPPMLGAPPPDPATIAAAPYLDFDSNAACVIDGRRQENVIFPTGTIPPPGDYTVRVDAASLCGQSGAQWFVGAMGYDSYGNGTLLDWAQWQATADDTRGTHVAGSGRLAFTFTIPSP
jgi:hypothetical protein